MHTQAGCKSSPSSCQLALRANVDLSNLLRKDDRSTERVTWPVNSHTEGTDQLPRSFRLLTKVCILLQCFTELFLPPWEKIKNKKKILACHIACAKICKVKSAVMSVEIQQRNSDNKNPKAEETLRSYGSSGEFTSDVPAPHTVTNSRDQLSAR